MRRLAKFNENDIAKVAEILLTKYYDKVYKKNENIDVFVNSDDFEEAVKKLNLIRTEAKFLNPFGALFWLNFICKI